MNSLLNGKNGGLNMFGQSPCIMYIYYMCVCIFYMAIRLCLAGVYSRQYNSIGTPRKAKSITPPAISHTPLCVFSDDVNDIVIFRLNTHTHRRDNRSRLSRVFAHSVLRSPAVDVGEYIIST